MINNIQLDVAGGTSRVFIHLLYARGHQSFLGELGMSVYYMYTYLGLLSYTLIAFRLRSLHPVAMVERQIDKIHSFGFHGNLVT